MNVYKPIVATLGGVALALAVGSATAQMSNSPGATGSTPSQDNRTTTQNGSNYRDDNGTMNGTQNSDNGARYNKPKKTTPHSDPTSEVPRPALQGKDDNAKGHVPGY